MTQDAQTQRTLSGNELPPLHEEEAERIVALMFDGAITIIAVIRCGLHCGAVRYLYPGLPGQAVAPSRAKELAERHGWRERTRQGERIWICPGCQRTV